MINLPTVLLEKIFISIPEETDGKDCIETLSLVCKTWKVFIDNNKGVFPITMVIEKPEDTERYDELLKSPGIFKEIRVKWNYEVADCREYDILLPPQTKMWREASHQYFSTYQVNEIMRIWIKFARGNSNSFVDSFEVAKLGAGMPKGTLTLQEFLAKRDDENFVRELVANYPRMLLYAGEGPRDDQDVVYSALRKDLTALAFANPRFGNMDEVAEMVQGRVECLNYLSRRFQYDREYVKEMIRRDPSNFFDLGIYWRRNFDICCLAVELHPDNFDLRITDTWSLDQCKQLALIAVRKKGLLLRKMWCLDDDDDVVEAALQQNGEALYWASPRHKSSLKSVRLAIQNKPPDREYFDILSWTNLPWNQETRHFAKEIVAKQGSAIFAFKDHAQWDLELVRIAYEQDKNIFSRLLPFTQTVLKNHLLRPSAKELKFDLPDPRLEVVEDLKLEPVAEDRKLEPVDTSFQEPPAEPLEQDEIEAEPTFCQRWFGWIWALICSCFR